MSEASPKELQEYLRADGRPPFAEWLTSLDDAKTRARIRVRLDRVRLGNVGDCRSLGGGIYELRIDTGPGYRIYFGQTGDTLTLLNGGAKGSQERDIRQAREYWQDFRIRQ